MKSALNVIQPFCILTTLLALGSFGIRAPGSITFTMQLIGCASAGLYKYAEDKKSQLIAEDAERNGLIEGWEAIEKEKEHIKSRIEEQLNEIAAWVEEQNQEIAAAYAALEKEKAEFYASISEANKKIDEYAAESSARKELLEIEHQQRLIDFERQMQEQRNELFSERHRLTVLEGRIEEREQDLELSYQLKVRQIEQEYLAKRGTILEEVRHEQEKLKVERELFEQEYNSKSLELQATWSEFHNEQVVWKQQQEELIAQFEEEANSRLEADVAELQEVLDQQKESFSLLAEHYEQQILELKLELEAERGVVTAPQSKGYAGYVANKLLEVIREFDGIRLEYHDCHEFSNSTREQPCIAIWLKRGEGTRAEQIIPLKKTIEMELGIGECKITLDPNGCIVVAFGEVHEGSLVHSVPLGKEEKQALLPGAQEREPLKGHITEPTPEMLHEALGMSSMIAVFGPTGGGKTSLVNNLLSYNSASFGENVEYVINDMKYPDPDALWRILGKEVTPQYHHFEEAECFAGLEDALAFFLARSRRRKQDAKAKRPISRFKKSIWVIDEVPTLVSSYGSQASKLIKGLVRLVRGLDGRIFIVGQTPRCSDYGMKIPDVSNFSRFYLGVDFATLGLKEVNISPRKRAQILADIWERQKLIEQQIAEGNVLPNGRAPASYFALVVTQSGNIFLWTLPIPLEYDSMQPVKEDQKIPVCAQEELTPISELDKKRFLSQIEAEEQSIAEAQEKAKEGKATELHKIITNTSINIKDMTPLQQAILLHAQINAGKWLGFSEMISKDRSIRSLNVKARDVKKACESLVRNWKVGTFNEGGKKFMIPASTEDSHENSSVYAEAVTNGAH